MVRKKRRKLLIYCCAVIALLLLVILTVEGVDSFKNRKLDTSEGLAVLKQAESGDVVKIESKIQKLEEKDQADAQEETGDTEKNYKALFANSVVMGDSISEALIEYDLLNASSVLSKIGVEIDDLDEQIQKAEKLNPQIIFLSYGMNDILGTNGDTQLFIEQYDSLLNTLQKKLPDTKIFVNSILPVQDKEVEEEPVYEKLDEYNKALRGLCDKRQTAFIDHTDLVSDRYYEEDGVHFKISFYPYWLNRMAEVASL